MSLPEDLALVAIKKLAVHQLPDKAGTAGVLSSIETPVLPDVRKFFEERIKSTLSKEGMAVDFDPSTASPVPTQVDSILLDSKPDFMAASQAIAQHLFDLQRKVHSEGLLCVALCEVRRRRAVAIMKLEKEEGVTADLVGEPGKQHFKIELNAIMLSSRTRLFKMGFFIRQVDASLDALASDSQIGGHAKFASYFLESFLGCMLVTQPNLATERFVTAVENFINQTVVEPKKKASYHIALLAELKSNRKSVNTNDFANENIDAGEDRKTLKQYLKKHEVPTPTFKKQLDLVQTKIGRVQLSFDNRTLVITPAEQIDDTVKIIEQESGLTRVEIEGRLEKVSGKK
jgi:hypothetical protein